MTLEVLKKCNLCPRNCGINRYNSVGVCGASWKIKLAYYSLHAWEEPIISGSNGSGTIFFSHCNLKCIFCQNKKISTMGYGKEVDEQRFIDIMLELQKKGAHNINLVTPTHYVPQIISGITKVKGKELKIPIVYNTSSYENIETIKSLENIVDVYLADLKYYDNNLGIRYSNCKDYFKYASAAIDEMYKQTGRFVIESNLIKRGVVVRILVLPNHVDDAINLINYLYKKYGDNIFISIMNQFTPVEVTKYKNLNRKLSNDEYNMIINHALDLGITYAFIQDGDTQDESFIPEFDISII